ncbi:MAG: hypothetical protein U1A77_24620 [Pirellulales bacterium]
MEYDYRTDGNYSTFWDNVKRSAGTYKEPTEETLPTTSQDTSTSSGSESASEGSYASAEVYSRESDFSWSSTFKVIGTCIFLIFAFIYGARLYHHYSAQGLTFSSFELSGLSPWSPPKSSGGVPAVASHAVVAAQESKELRESRIEQAKWRSWIVRNRALQGEAKFVMAIENRVTLEMPDGRRVHLEMDELSPEDIDFIRGRRWLEAASP